MGRPSRLTPEVQERVLTALRLGAPLAAAAGAAGISDRTLRRWMAEGRAAAESPPSGREPAALRRKRGFFEEVSRAQDEAHVRYAAMLAKAAKDGDFRAVSFALERRWPEHWGRRERLEHHATEAPPFDLEAIASDPEALDRYMDMVRELRRTLAEAAARQGGGAEQGAP